MSKSATGSAALVMASRLALPKKGNVSLLNATMKAKTKACNQDEAVALSLRLNESRHSLDATPLRLKVAAKVQAKKK
jgi:hypothetical protein